jgi:monoamine oxidase
VAHDVLVLGAGLAGLAAARDLARAGADVLVIEARERVGGRVEQACLEDGRLVQLGGEVVGRAHTAYLELAAELGLTLVDSYVAEPGELTQALQEGVFVGAPPAWLTAADRACCERLTAELVALARTVDPDDPWSHPDAVRLDRLSVTAWLRAAGASPNVVRYKEVGALALAAGSNERTSLLSALRKVASAGGTGDYDDQEWEGLRLAEGSATLALRMADELDGRVRLGAPVRAVSVAPGCCKVTLRSGEPIRAHAVVSALPVGPLRDVAVEGLSAARLASLERQRHAPAAKVVAAYETPFWRELGQNGLSESEGVLSSTWPQSEGILSCLVPPERLASYVATAPGRRIPEALAEVARLFGPDALGPVATFERLWGVDPWTQGYVTQWHPGDVLAVGPLHGTHEPPFYVCGSDQWVAGYMEGAVRTGRAAAAAALAGG